MANRFPSHPRNREASVWLLPPVDGFRESQISSVIVFLFVMNPLLGVLAASVMTFAATNVDDLLLLTFLFARRIPTGRVVAGQYLGFLGIVTLSLCGVWLALGMPHSWIRLLRHYPVGNWYQTLF
jgi:hypothetical protein